MSRINIHFESVLEKIARMLTRNYGVNVVIRGSGASTDGKTIYLPMFEDMSQEMFDDLLAFTDHEVCHVKYTTFPEIKGVKNNFHKHFLNHIEDSRIELLLPQEYPGTAINLKRLNRKWGAKMHETWGTLLWPIRLIIAMRNVYDGVEPRVDADFKPLFDHVRPMVAKLPECKSTKEVREATHKIIDAINEKRRQLALGLPEPEGDSEEEVNESSIPLGDKKKKAKRGSKELYDPATEMIDGDGEDELGESKESESDDGDESKDSKDSKDSESKSKEKNKGKKPSKSKGKESDDPAEESKEAGEGDSESEDESSDKKGDGKSGKDSSEKKDAKDTDESKSGESKDKDKDKGESKEKGDSESKDKADEKDATGEGSGDSDSESTGEESGDSTPKDDESKESSEASSSKKASSKATKPNKTEAEEEITPEIETRRNYAKWGEKETKMMEESADTKDSEFDRHVTSSESYIENQIEKEIKVQDIKPNEHRGMYYGKEKDIKRAVSLPYTREFDEVKDYSGKGDPVKYGQMKRKVMPVVNPIRMALERMLKVRENSRILTYRDRGQLNKRSLHQLAADPSFRYPFQELTKFDTRNVAVELLIDLSGSMSGDKVEMARQSALAIGESLASLNIAFEMTGFHTEGNYYSARASALSTEGDTSRFNRFGERLIHYVFKDFNTTSLVGITNAHSGGSNADGESVTWAAKRLAERREKRKILFVFSDGQPAHPGADHMCLAGDLKRVVEDLTKSQMDVVGFGIQTEAVAMFYPDWVIVHELRDLPIKVMNKLSKLLEKGYK